MIIVDKALEKLEKEGNPIRVAMVGAGFMGKGIALQFQTAAKGMQLVAISNRTLDKAVTAYEESGVEDGNIAEVHSQKEMDNAIRESKSCVTTDPMLLCHSDEIDVIIEVTGAVQFSAEVVLAAIRNKKDVVLMNAELDGTVGPLLKVYADQNGVTITNADGDQPGVIMNLYRFVKGIGVKPVLCGNIKGLQDEYRNPTTQEGFAKKWGQKPSMVTSFADGSKISFEQAIVANATGMKVGKRGMHGPTVETGTPLEEAITEYPDELLNTEEGVVDYVVGASPGPGVFVIGTHDHPQQQHYLHLYKLGKGPYYCFYTPYHLCHFEVPNTVARAFLFDDATIAPSGAPTVEVVTIAKKDLKAGEEIDGIGHYMTYGVCENAETAHLERLLPLGVAEGCVLKRDVKKDEALTYDDVQVPEGRLIDELRREQKEHFGVPHTV
ncbi:Predicted homoserine dehydrogenase, contains C-terminal SAF domain [Fodinibius roseus]|uniref:Predicted homoserine dehydrogenase, contains C-terminal SAF domain n=1 Tax=Fodinibius roseus TaxID=1194090 RepID=A0A1M4SU07_9BACT|nr:Gfo/Idh/MocA family oxidoreductase [Fodinibius roseus]SHE35713.1 Predicted homoserine dehydrogenase, contains C-terminal SAF domain [Fodinibius roseus]